MQDFVTKYTFDPSRLALHLYKLADRDFDSEEFKKAGETLKSSGH
jgi:hypothetical protein